MIRTECVVFLSMVGGGALAALVATLFFALGQSSRVSRAVFDFLTPLSVGAIFFFDLYFSSGGVFRLYEVIAFFLGGAIFCFVYLKIRPFLKLVFLKAYVPIKSLENAVNKRLEPVLKRREERKRRVREKREEKRRAVMEKKEKRRKEKARIKRRNKQKEQACRRRFPLRGRGTHQKGRPKRRKRALISKVIDNARESRYNKR